MKKFKKFIGEAIKVLVAIIFANALALIICFTLPDRPSIAGYIAMTMVFYLCFLWVFEEKSV